MRNAKRKTAKRRSVKKGEITLSVNDAGRFQWTLKANGQAVTPGEDFLTEKAALAGIANAKRDLRGAKIVRSPRIDGDIARFAALRKEARKVERAKVKGLSVAATRDAVRSHARPPVAGSTAEAV